MKKLLLFLILVLTSSHLCYADDLLTLADFRRASQDQSVLKTNPFYPDSVWNSWINEACCDLSSYGIIEKFDTLTWISGVMVYSLNSGFIILTALFSLQPEGKVPVDIIPAKDVCKSLEPNTRKCWQSGKGESAVVGFYPIPVAIDTFLVIYGAEAEDMDSDNDTTEIPYSYRPLVIDYVVYRALLRDGQRSASDRYHESYMRRLEVKLKFEGKRYDVFISPQEIKP